jgi:hypothetical protein
MGQASSAVPAGDLELDGARSGVGVFVLGMHRSGTSVATRLINLLGLPAPVEEDLLPPDRGNPTGYWESSSLVACNDRLLEALGSDMTCPEAFGSGWERDPRLHALYPEAAKLFAQAFPAPPWVFKDPRNCITFPFWVRALEIQPVVILLHRNPCEIVASYRTHWGERDGIPFLLALWERYLRQALCHIEGSPVLVTSYEQLVADPVAWTGRAREFLVRSGLTVPEPQEDAILDYVDPQLRRAALSRRDFFEDPAVSDAQRALLLALEDMDGAHDAFVPPALPPETATTDALLFERRRAMRIVRELPATRRARAWRRLRQSRYLAPARAAYRGIRRSRAEEA